MVGAEVKLAILAGVHLLSSLAAAEFGNAAPPGTACGSARTRVTVCLPGRPDNSTCTYSIISDYSPDNLAPNITQLPCKDGPIFEADCASLAGSLFVAYGPCNADDVMPPLTADNSRSVGDWLDVIGINSLQELGSLFVRGYAFQQPYSVEPDTLLPHLNSFAAPSPDQLSSISYFQVSISGQQVPMLPWITSLPGGLSILNSPDVDFMDPPRFQRLSDVGSVLRIAGSQHLESLAGLEALRTGAEATRLELIGLPRLSDVSALAGFYRCRPDGSTALQPGYIFGVAGVHPRYIQAVGGGCVLITAGQLCQYIAQPDRCPNATEYVRFSDGTLQRKPTTIPPPTAASGPRMAPAAAPPYAEGTISNLTSEHDLYPMFG